MSDEPSTRPLGTGVEPDSGSTGLAGLTLALGSGAAGAGPDPLLGCDIGGVELVRVIAEGGMGRVYEGRQEKPGRTVAVKVMRPGLASPALLKRFEYEAEVLGRLQHPGIAHIYAVGVHRVGQSSVPYFVMEYIAGARSLTAYADEAKLPTRGRLELFRRVCDAVAHGHQKGVIHRDLKPGNILVDALGQPKVIDFGVARATDSDMALTTMQTDVGQLVGTLRYMSPEQTRGDPNEIDVRSDVYALGVVLYELLVGRMPYDLDKKAAVEVMRIVQQEDPTPLSALDRTLTGDVAVIAGTCLQKDRSRRYSSASELGADIARYLAGEPITASPPGFVDGIARLARRHRAAALAVAAVFATLVLAVVGMSVFAARAKRQQLAAERALDFIGDTLRASNPREWSKPVTLGDVLRDARRRLQASDTLDDRAKATTLLVLARSFLGLGLSEDARSASASARELFESVSGPDSKESLDALCLVLESELGGADPAAAVPLGERLLAARQAGSGAGHPDTIEAMTNLAVAYSHAERFDEAIALSRRAVDLRVALHGADDRETLLARNNLAVSLRRAGHTAEATALYRDVVEAATDVLGERDPDTLQFLFNYGCALSGAGALHDAARALREAYDARDATLGPEHPDTLESLAALAKVLVKMEVPQRARELLAPALPRLRAALQTGDEATAPLRDVVSYLFPEVVIDQEDAGRVDESVREIYRAVKARDFTEADESCRRAAAAVRDDERASARVSRWQLLVSYAHVFASLRDEAVAAAAAAGGEHDLGSHRIVVVDATREAVVYRDSRRPGRNLQVSRDALPPDVEWALLAAWLAAASRPADQLVLGAAALAREEPDVTRARSAWRTAAAAGEPHAAVLLALLDDPVVGGGGAADFPE